MKQPRYFVTPMLVADIDHRSFDAMTLSLLRSKAEYYDTDESLDEFFVSTGEFEEIKSITSNTTVHAELDALIEETSAYAYIRVLYL